MCIRDRFYGVPVVINTGLNGTLTAAAGYGTLIGDFANHAEFAVNPGGAAVTVGTVNDQFNKDQMTLKSRIFGVMAVLRPQAFARIPNMES